MNGVAAVGERAVRPRAPLGSGWAAVAGLALGLPLSLALSGALPLMTLQITGGVAFLAFVALALIRFDAAVVLAFALLGFVVVDPAPVDLLLVVLIAVTAATGRFKSRAPASVVAALAALLALNLLSAVEVIQTGRAAAFLATTTYLALFGFWLSGFVDSRSRARLVTNGYLFAAATSTVIGLLALFVAFPGADQVVEFGRVRGFFQDPNVFGPFLIPVALILLEDILTPRLLGLRPLAKAALLFLLVLGVVFSFSRGAWVNLVVGLGIVLMVLGLRRRGGRKAFAVLALAAGLAASVALILAATGSEGFLLERAHFQSYDNTRFSTQVVGIQSAERYPFGVGPGQFESYAPQSAHSTYVRVLGEQGLPGLFVLVLALTFTLVAALANAVAGRETYGIGSAALLGSWCGMLVNSIVVDTLHWRHFWIVAALIWAGRARSGALRPRSATAARAARA